MPTVFDKGAGAGGGGTGEKLNKLNLTPAGQPVEAPPTEHSTSAEYGKYPSVEGLYRNGRLAGLQFTAGDSFSGKMVILYKNQAGKIVDSGDARAKLYPGQVVKMGVGPNSETTTVAVKFYHDDGSVSQTPDISVIQRRPA